MAGILDKRCKVQVFRHEEYLRIECIASTIDDCRKERRKGMFDYNCIKEVRY